MKPSPTTLPKNSRSGQSLVAFITGLPIMLLLAITGFLVVFIPFSRTVQSAIAYKQSRRALYAQTPANHCPQSNDWNSSQWFSLSVQCNKMNQVHVSASLFSKWKTPSQLVQLPLPKGK